MQTMLVLRDLGERAAYTLALYPFVSSCVEVMFLVLRLFAASSPCCRSGLTTQSLYCTNFRHFRIRSSSYHRLQHVLKFLDRESVDLFHGDAYKASEVAHLLLLPTHSVFPGGGR